MQEYRPLFMAVTFGFLAFAFYLTYRPRDASTSGRRGPHQKIMTLNKVMLWGVAVVAVIFLFFPQLFTSSVVADDVFTADMDRTVINIDGMT